MSWDTKYLLEGIFTFGTPLNMWRWEVYQVPAGWEPLPYYRLHIFIDDDPHLWDRLIQKTKTGATIHYYERLIVMHLDKSHPKEISIYKPWIYSLERSYHPSRYPRESWQGHTLGLAFDKTKANDAAIRTLGDSGFETGWREKDQKSMGRP